MCWCYVVGPLGGVALDCVYAWAGGVALVTVFVVVLMCVLVIVPNSLLVYSLLTF